MPNKSVMNVKILGEAGYEYALLGIQTNKKKYEKDMTSVSQQLAKAGGGHDKFLEMIHIWLDMTTCRSIWQQFDTYRVGVTKSSESTHHRLIEDVLDKCIDYKKIETWFIHNGYTLNVERLPSRELPMNATALIVSKANKNTLSALELQEFMKKYLIVFNPEMEAEINIIENIEFVANTLQVLKDSFNIDYEQYYTMFEGGSDAITKDTVDIMVDLAMSLEENRFEKLHRLKRMLPEGFLQRRVVSLNYKVIRNMMQQRYKDPFNHWQMFFKQFLEQCEHPEYFDDILEKFK
jgi:hypothetical protein